MLPLAEWQTFLAVQAGAAATLTGLVFVAVSINLGRIIAIPGLSGRARDSLVQLLQVFFVSTAALVPRQPAALLAAEVLGISVVSWIAQVIGQIQYGRVRAGHPRLWLITRVVAGQIATVPLCVAGVLLLRENPNGIYWLVPGFILSFIAGVTSAWVLLVEILR
jgi:modulator of FtsH protease